MYERRCKYYFYQNVKILLQQKVRIRVLFQPKLWVRNLRWFLLTISCMAVRIVDGLCFTVIGGPTETHRNWRTENRMSELYLTEIEIKEREKYIV